MTENMGAKSPRKQAEGTSRNETEKKLLGRLAEMRSGNGKISISAVAKAAGVTPALIHNTYPEVAEKIRAAIGKSSRVQRDAKHEALVREREVSRGLRDEVSHLRKELAILATNNQLLVNEVANARGTTTANVVKLIARK